MYYYFIEIFLISPRGRVLWVKKPGHHTTGIWQKLNLKLKTEALTSSSVPWYWRTSGTTGNDSVSYGHYGIFLSMLSNVFFPIILFASSDLPVSTHSSLQTLPSNYGEKPLKIIDLIIWCRFLQGYRVSRPTAFVSWSFPWCTSPCRLYSFIWNYFAFSKISLSSNSFTFPRIVSPSGCLSHLWIPLSPSSVRIDY